MYEFDVKNINTGKHVFMYGYNAEDMMRRHPNFNWDEWEIRSCEYVD